MKSDTSTPVGTPDYISPEILNVIEGRNNNQSKRLVFFFICVKRHLTTNFYSGTPYSFETDWWSLGIVIFESFYGETPFYAESLVETYFKIMNHKIHFMVSHFIYANALILIIRTFVFKLQFPVNAKVTDEAKDLISNLITDRAARYKSIDQFKSHSWFTGLDWDKMRYQVPPYQPNFTGPEDTSNFDISDLKPINNPITVISTNKDANLELSFVGFTATFTGEITTDEDKSLQTAILQSLKLNEKEHESPSLEPSIQIDGQPTAPSPVAIDAGDPKSQETIALLESRLKSANQEWSEMSNLLTEMKKEKNTLSNKLRIKEEELDEQIEKNSQLRTQMRSYEKTKRQHLEEIANLQTELNTLKVIRKQGIITFINYIPLAVSNVYAMLKLVDQNSIKDYQEKLENLEKQLKVDTESSKLLTNEKQMFVKQVSDLEQQVLTLEEENVALKSDNSDLKKYVQDINAKILGMDNFNIKCENELKSLIEIVQKEQQSRSSLEQMLDMIEYNVKKYKFVLDKGSLKQESNLVGTLSKNNASWQERRSARVDKQELLTLQLELKSEIADKQKIQSELTKLQEDFDHLVFQLNESKGEVSRLKKQTKALPFTDGSNADTSKSDRNESDSEYRDNSLLKEYLLDKSTLMTLANNNKRQSLIGMPQEMNDNFDYHNKFGHSFIIRTFLTPLKCYICTSLMIGLVRQGYVCEGRTHLHVLGTGTLNYTFNCVLL